MHFLLKTVPFFTKDSKLGILQTRWGHLNRDYSVVLGTALIYFSIVIAFNLLVDLAYAWLDPRVREGL